MNSELIMRLLVLAITLAKQHMDGADLADTLLDIFYKAAQAYREQTGKTLNTDFIQAEETL